MVVVFKKLSLSNKNALPSGRACGLFTLNHRPYPDCRGLIMIRAAMVEENNICRDCIGKHAAVNFDCLLPFPIAYFPLPIERREDCGLPYFNGQ
jgi:hypothetical protein